MPDEDEESQGSEEDANAAIEELAAEKPADALDEESSPDEISPQAVDVGVERQKVQRLGAEGRGNKSEVERSAAKSLSQDAGALDGQLARLLDGRERPTSSVLEAHMARLRENGQGVSLAAGKYGFDPLCVDDWELGMRARQGALGYEIRNIRGLEVRNALDAARERGIRAATKERNMRLKEEHLKALEYALKVRSDIVQRSEERARRRELYLEAKHREEELDSKDRWLVHMEANQREQIRRRPDIQQREMQLEPWSRVEYQKAWLNDPKLHTSASPRLSGRQISPSRSGGVNLTPRGRHYYPTYGQTGCLSANDPRQQALQASFPVDQVNRDHGGLIEQDELNGAYDDLQLRHHIQQRYGVEESRLIVEDALRRGMWPQDILEQRPPAPHAQEGGPRDGQVAEVRKAVAWEIDLEKPEAIEVRGFGKDTTEEDLKEAFGRFGTITFLASKDGVATIHFVEPGSAAAATEALNETELKEVTIGVVNLAALPDIDVRVREVVEVSGLMKGVVKNDLKKAFSEFGTIALLEINKGAAKIYFEEEGAAAAATEAMNDTEWKDMKIQVKNLTASLEGKGKRPQSPVDHKVGLRRMKDTFSEHDAVQRVQTELNLAHHNREEAERLRIRKRQEARSKLLDEQKANETVFAKEMTSTGISSPRSQMTEPDSWLDGDRRMHRAFEKQQQKLKTDSDRAIERSEREALEKARIKAREDLRRAQSERQIRRAARDHPHSPPLSPTEAERRMRTAFEQNQRSKADDWQQFGDHWAHWHAKEDARLRRVGDRQGENLSHQKTWHEEVQRHTHKGRVDRDHSPPRVSPPYRSQTTAAMLKGPERVHSPPRSNQSSQHLSTSQRSTSGWSSSPRFADHERRRLH